ncbi:centrosome-associated protein 350-like [Contarinia nasturtii]|uniref:centrosome-associated protein 350-like n=1 Tax=Contarinia nasturtii TaxID=265458 RepID=UPI0012D3952A|nr:centrosome-associated protein 350-like [Contarinia nasturtii]
MNAGKENDNKSEQNALSANLSQNKMANRLNGSKVADPQKVVAKPRTTTQKTGKTPSAINAAFKATKSTTATATKITKLVLKPKPTAPKSSLTSKVTTKKYITKPVSIKSRSTMISHESTFRIQSIKKTLPSKKQSDQNELILMKNEQISQQLIVNANSSKINETLTLNKPYETVHCEQNSNEMSVNVTKIMDSPILQEITQAVVNGSNLVKSPKKHCENNAKCKSKFYDPIKARQFIQMQKEQRKQADKEKSNAPASKEEIKQRLSALRKNTLEILEKNVQKAKKSNVQTRKLNTFTPKATKISTHQQKDSHPKKTKETPNALKTPLMRFQSKVSPSLALTPSKFLPSIKTDKIRIGILRRTEGESPTIENDLAEDEIPPIGSANIEPNHSVSNADFNLSPEKSVHNTSFKSKSVQCEFELKVPDTVPLKSSLLHERNGMQHEFVEENDGQYEGASKPREIPFWLRPTPVQPYPYNFIVAVRKKLESITNPVFGPCRQYQWPDPHETSFHSPVAQPDKVFSSNYRRNFDRTQSESEKSMNENIKSNDIEDEDQKEYEMDFSSVTFESKRNRSNNRSKSKRKTMNGSQDTLSISSGILSHSSPEKKVRTTTSDDIHDEKDNDERQPSPLTTDNVDGLHITSRSLSQHERISNANSVVSRQSIISSVASHINFSRGKDYSEQSIPSLHKLSQQHSVAQLLNDFKTSLSAAIEANQRLHEMLSNPPSSRQYSDDFEHESDNKQSHISERITETHENTSIPSYKSSYIVSATQTNGPTSEERSDECNSSTSTKIAEDVIVVSSNRESIPTNQNEESTQKGGSSQIYESSRTPKDSSTMIEEKIDDYQSSESPTNNDLKSVSLSIAKKSAPTSDDTDQASNAIESFNKQITGDPDMANKSVANDIFDVFNKTELNLNGDANKSLWSEHNISYSTLGACDQLLKTETRKSQDLASMLKIREKSLVDRFKGQIAWLELQKQKFKECGLTAEITMIKKKQRALLLRLNNDRQELHRILKERQQMDSAKNSSLVNYNISQMSTNMSIRRTSIAKQLNDTTGKRAVKAIELPGGGTALETMLQKRENELRRRREYVEKLLRWHQRLDVEESEVIKMEQMIMFISTSDVYQTTSREQINDTLSITVQHTKRTNCHRSTDNSSVHERSQTNVNDSITMERTRFEHKKQKQIHNIEKSLNTLKMISSRSISSDIEGGSNADDFVEIYGRQLNKLWKRLTGEYEKKYSPDKVYTLNKSDLERLYEQAKSVVLQQFHVKDELKRRLIDNSMSFIDASQQNSVSMPQLSETKDENIDRKTEPEINVPTLNLASSPEPRDNVNSDTDQGYYFSNSINEEISEEKNQSKPEPQSVEPSDGMSANVEGSEIQTEQAIEEEDEHSESVQEDVESDITEDSLNKAKTSTVEDISPTEIETTSQVNESQTIESEIPSAIESSTSTIPFELNLSDKNNTQLIEETSFPNIDIQTTVSSIVESDIVSPEKKSSSHSRLTDKQTYHSNDFEESKSLTSISTATVTKVTTTTTPTVSQSTEKTITPTTEPSKDLEERLILIDEGLKELSETISHSPILKIESEITNGSKSIDTEKSSVTSVSSSDNESKQDDEIKTIESIEKSEENSENCDEKTVESETPTESTLNEPTSIGTSNGAPKVDSDESTDSIAAEIAASKENIQTSTELLLQKRPYQYTLSASSIDYNKVPEAALKRSQIPLESEIKTAEQSTAMFPFLREIPNKPPPPYPVHRQLPKTPSDDRIKEIVNRRVEELYEKLNSPQSPETPIRNDATFVKSPTLSISSPDSPATQDDPNIFERIILDSCEEIMQEISAQEKQLTGIFRQPLTFYKPPNRLKCFQQHTLRRIFKLLNRPSGDSINSDESKSYSGMRSFLPSRVAQLTFNNRRKRDAVDDILIQELYEDEARWTNFDLEEKEIRENVADLKTLLADDSSSFINTTNTE